MTDDPATLFFSAQLGRLSNCMLSVNAARFVASSLRLRLAVPPCRTSPYGEQACAPHLNIPDQRQSLVEFELLRALDSRDLGGCTEKSAGSAVAVTALPLRPTLRDVTCVVVTEQIRCARPEFQRHKACRDELSGGLAAARAAAEAEAAKTLAKGLQNCEEELRRTPALRGYAPMRFTRFVELPAAELRAGAGTALDGLRRRGGDVFLGGTFQLGADVLPLLGAPPLKLCAHPRPRPSIEAMVRTLVARLELDLDRTLCVHWRGEDFFHPTSIQRHAAFATAQKVAERVAADAKKARVDRVLVVSNARFEALEELLRRLRSGELAADATRSSPQLNGTAFGCADGSFFAAFAEKAACARTRWFLGSFGSTFSEHIAAMRASEKRETEWMGSDHRWPVAWPATRGRGSRPRNVSRASGGPRTFR